MEISGRSGLLLLGISPDLNLFVFTRILGKHAETGDL